MHIITYIHHQSMSTPAVCSSLHGHVHHMCMVVLQGYEPYLIAARKNVPWYDERFRGQGRDRIVQTLNMAGFVSFTVHPTVYLMQQPHSVAPTTQLAKALPQYIEVAPLLCTLLSTCICAKGCQGVADGCRVQQNLELLNDPGRSCCPVMLGRIVRAQ